MFKTEEDKIDIWIKVSYRAAHLEKSNQLSFLYFDNGDRKVLEDKEGNIYVPHLAIEVNGGEYLLKSEREIEDKLGLQTVEYIDYGVSEVYNE